MRETRAKDRDEEKLRRQATRRRHWRSFMRRRRHRCWCGRSGHHWRERKRESEEGEREIRRNRGGRRSLLSSPPCLFTAATVDRSRRRRQAAASPDIITGGLNGEARQFCFCLWFLESEKTLPLLLELLLLLWPCSGSTLNRYRCYLADAEAFHHHWSFPESSWLLPRELNGCWKLLTALPCLIISTSCDIE
ncbi:uncharacterized protein [Arachis hypogaea]|uniref:uncharacterized protein n=1 Tax=Arachis hypogaea TaxID=3818 RepID=UPI000DED00CE|nr:uncharacterized protein LOC112790760 [Arachis hypogaea]QHO57748.1 uncharacterized protein DS421_3g84920 [Arachis hypogaea]